MKILFVNMYDYSVITENSVPHGILSLATVLKNSKDFNVKVIDLHRIFQNKILTESENLEVNLLNTANYLMQFNPDVISIYTMCNTHAMAIMLARTIKNINNRSIIVLGGPEATLSAEKTLKMFDFIDFIGLSEGEETIESILYGIEKNDFSRSKGICYRDASGNIIKKDIQLNDNLDSLPIVDFDLLEFEIKDLISIEVGRGCPFECIFCSAKEYWNRKFRLKSNKRICDEIIYYKSKYGIKDFSFTHDLFTASRKRIVEICEMLINNNLGITWWCSSRCDTIDEELITLMSKAGCTSIYFGVESGSKRVQKIMKKNLDLDKIPALVQTLKQHKIEPTFSFIYGFPQETKEDVNDTMKLIYILYEEYREAFQSRRANIQLHKLSFLSQTEVTKEYQDDLEYIKDYHIEIITLDKWKNEYLTEIIKNKDVFPQHNEYRSDLRTSLQYLDKYFTDIFIAMIGYLDMTYKLLIEHFNQNHIAVYMEFIKAVKADSFERCSYQITKSSMLRIYYAICAFSEFVQSYDFGVDTELIREMNDFEAKIFGFIYMNQSTKCIIEQNYKYDVYTMKNERSIRPFKKKTCLEFVRSEQEASIYKKA